MHIEIKARNCPVNDDLRQRADKRFAKIARQVSPLAELEIELFEERNPAIAEAEVVDATLYLKGVTLRAREASTDMIHSLNLCADDLARQVKRHRDKRRRRREARVKSAVPQSFGGASPTV
jgi:putative sigma-54 modulation protein